MQVHTRFDESELALMVHQALMLGHNRMDENLALFMARQVDYLKTKAYEVEYAPQSAMRIFPMTSEIPAEAKNFIYGIYDSVGMAKIIADYSDDLPTVDANYREETGRVFRLGDGYHLSIDEAKIAQRAGTNINDRKARAARKAVDTKMNDLAWRGDEAHQIPSIFDHPNIPRVLSAGWTTGDIALRELATAIKNIVTITKGNHRANRIVIPPSTNDVFTQRADGTTISMRDYFVTQYPGLTWEEAYELEDIDGKGTKGALVFEFDPDNLSIEVPEPFNQLAPQAQNLHYKVPCTAKTTGLTVYRPLTIQIITGL